MNWDKKGRLTKQFVLYLAVMLLAVIGTTNYWLYQLSVRDIASSLDGAAEAKLSGMVSLSAYYLSHFENQLLMGMVTETGKHQGVDYVGIHSSDGAINYYAGRKDAPRTRLYLRTIQFHDQTIGRVELGLDTTAMRDALSKAGWTALALACLSVLTLGGMLFFFFRTQVMAVIERDEQEKTRIRDEQEFFKAVMNTADYKVLVLDPRCCIVLANRSCIEMMHKAKEDDIIGKPIWQHIAINLGDWSLNAQSVDSSGVLNPTDLRQLTEERVYTILPQTEQRETVVEWTFTKFAESAGGLRYIIGAGTDVTVQYHEARRLSHLAHHDVLTGLPNRSLFHERLQDAALKYQRNNTSFALLYIDLDKFKPINDTLGHEAGDYVLQQVALRMVYVLRKADTVARLGGDEFGVILHDMGNRELASRVTKKLLDAIASPLSYHSHTLQVGASIGITLFPNDSTDLKQLMAYADSAMYQAKQSGRNTYCVFDT
ncbi:MAG: sensor domain-containing diguanylate cyclase [Rhodoferax sp.]|nr:sensor domain-containing diguanylate cyclase [Rhodoferax sp.]